jgi:hypothetical protein
VVWALVWHGEVVLTLGVFRPETAPQAPDEAEAGGDSGDRRLAGHATSDGKLGDVCAISGPPQLQDATVDAVRQWTYKPYLLNGQPVEVRTQEHVVFVWLGGGHCINHSFSVFSAGSGSHEASS